MVIIYFANFINNTAINGGALYTLRETNATFQHITATGNKGCAMFSFNSMIVFAETTTLTQNFDGGLYTFHSSIIFNGHTLFDSNVVPTGNGGAMTVGSSEISLNNITFFAHNSAPLGSGGAMSAISSNININNTAIFAFNRAIDGGAVHLDSSSTLTLEAHANMTTTRNVAARYGGAIFYNDAVTSVQCKYEMSSESSRCCQPPADNLYLTDCFVD